MNNLKFIILDYLVAKKSWTDADISAIAPQTVSRTCL